MKRDYVENRKAKNDERIRGKTETQRQDRYNEGRDTQRKSIIGRNKTMCLTSSANIVWKSAMKFLYIMYFKYQSKSTPPPTATKQGGSIQ